MTAVDRETARGPQGTRGSLPPRHVFVVGCPRSGTSLVGELIARQPLVYDAGEFHFPYLLWRELERPLSELNALFVREATDLVIDFVDRAVTDARKEVFLNHSPWHVLCLDHILAAFPGARVVHVVRHPSAVTESLGRSYRAGYRWAGASFHERLRLWRSCAEAALVWQGREGFVEVRYEDLMRAPEAVTRDLFARLSLDWEPDVLYALATLHAGATSWRRPRASVNPDGSLTIHRYRPEPGRDSPWHKAVLERKIGHLVARYGYDLWGGNDG